MSRAVETWQLRARFAAALSAYRIHHPYQLDEKVASS
jgi:hypothetical protein